MNKEQLIEELMKQSDKIFFYCVKRCNSRIDAEDLSQDILLDIIININKGIEIKNFDYYIWQICKNHYSKYINNKVKERDSITCVEDINEPADNINILDELVENEKIAMINASIKLLSRDYSEILYSYYVEDNTMHYISKNLNLPLGTVKRRLFDIRNKLKEYLKMERLNGKKAYVPKKYTPHRSGGGGFTPEDYIDSLINQNILIHSYNNPCSLEDYAIEVGISKPYIEDIVKKLEYATLLMKDRNGKYLTNIAMIDKNIDIKIRNFVEKKTIDYAMLLVDYCKKHFYEWKKLINNPLLDDNKLMWTYIFNINRKVEYLDCTKEETIKNKREYTHVVNNSGFDLYMTEEYYSELPGFSINECINGNGIIGVQGLCYPGQNDINNIRSEALKCLKWDNSANWGADFELFGYLLKNKKIKYSDCVYTLKTAVDKMVKENYLKIVNDEIKFNFVMFNFDEGIKNKDNDYDIELNNAKLKRKEITREIEEILKEDIPEYLYKDLSFISLSYFVQYARQHVIQTFENEGLIKPINNENRFVYNMFCWERK